MEKRFGFIEFAPDLSGHLEPVMVEIPQAFVFVTADMATIAGEISEACYGAVHEDRRATNTAAEIAMKLADVNSRAPFNPFRNKL